LADKLSIASQNIDSVTLKPHQKFKLNPVTFEAAKTRFQEVMHLSLEENIVRPPLLSHAVTACSSTFTDSNIHPHTIN
jgi:hypothetical protein